MKGAVASGHPKTTEAAAYILRKGGNAFDAMVAAGFAATVAEPTLASLGGGGFLLVYKAETLEEVLYDFFVDTPGKDSDIATARLVPVDLHFKSTVQRFYIGMGSVAVPGTLKGLIECYHDLCSMEMEDLISPTLRYLDEGVEVTEEQIYQIEILKPILTFTEYGKEIFDISHSRRLFNPLLREFLKNCSPESWIETFYCSGAEALVEEVRKAGGILTKRDMAEYKVFRRTPLGCSYRGFDIVTNPPPAMGGELICHALKFLSKRDLSSVKEKDRVSLTVKAMEEMKRCKGVFAGTTHISILDAAGNAASMTFSNGTGSGCFFPGTGIMLNNMMGEDELHPKGLFSSHPGVRVNSMMSPTLIKRDDRIYAILGSGGSKRIRTAMLQVILNLIDVGMDVRDAVEASRIHLDDEGVIQAEPDFAPEVIAALKELGPVNQWQSKDLYFGGVHTVMSDYSGWGDSRRGGSFQRVE